MYLGCSAAINNLHTYIVNNIAAVIADQIAIHHNRTPIPDTFRLITFEPPIFYQILDRVTKFFILNYCMLSNNNQVSAKSSNIHPWILPF